MLLALAANPRVKEMRRMTDEINTRTFDNKARVTCWMCHRGEDHPPQGTFSKELPESFAKMPPSSLSKPAEQVFKDVRELKGMDARNFGLMMGWFSKELGVKCAHCHDQNDFAAEMPRKTRAREMLQMTNYVAKDFYRADDSPVGCGMCHRGFPRPSRAP
jgi:hypothetical protein